MPIYEYVCDACDHGFELLVQGSRKPSCPSCGSHRLEKRFSAFAVSTGRSSLSGGAPVGTCGTCGDPRGPGACSL